MTTPRTIQDVAVLSYSYNPETWYRESLHFEDRQSIEVMASLPGDGGLWTFTAHMRQIGTGVSLVLEMYSDAFQSLEDVPELFLAMAHEKPDSLPEFRAILDRLGAVDETQRTQGATG